MKSLSIESASLAASETVEFLFAGLVPSTVNTGFNDQDAERGGPERTALRMLVKSQFRTRYRSFPHSEFGGAGEVVAGERKVKTYLREIQSVTPSLVSVPRGSCQLRSCLRDQKTGLHRGKKI